MREKVGWGGPGASGEGGPVGGERFDDERVREGGEEGCYGGWGREDAEGEGNCG